MQDRPREQIVKFHELALQRGGTTVRAPGGRPDIGPDYFGATSRDLDGHMIEVVHQSM
jgi:predicted lactoylglutathione lyase